MKVLVCYNDNECKDLHRTVQFELPKKWHMLPKRDLLKLYLKTYNASAEDPESKLQLKDVLFAKYEGVQISNTETRKQYVALKYNEPISWNIKNGSTLYVRHVPGATKPIKKIVPLPEASLATNAPSASVSVTSSKKRGGKNSLGDKVNMERKPSFATVLFGRKNSTLAKRDISPDQRNDTPATPSNNASKQPAEAREGNDSDNTARATNSRSINIASNSVNDNGAKVSTNDDDTSDDISIVELSNIRSAIALLGIDTAYFDNLVKEAKNEICISTSKVERDAIVKSKIGSILQTSFMRASGGPLSSISVAPSMNNAQDSMPVATVDSIKSTTSARSGFGLNRDDDEVPAAPSFTEYSLSRKLSRLMGISPKIPDANAKTGDDTGSKALEAIDEAEAQAPPSSLVDYVFKLSQSRLPKSMQSCSPQPAAASSFTADNSKDETEESEEDAEAPAPTDAVDEERSLKQSASLVDFVIQLSNSMISPMTACATGGTAPIETAAKDPEVTKEVEPADAETAKSEAVARAMTPVLSPSTTGSVAGAEPASNPTAPEETTANSSDNAPIDGQVTTTPTKDSTGRKQKKSLVDKMWKLTQTITSPISKNKASKGDDKQAGSKTLEDTGVSGNGAAVVGAVVAATAAAAVADEAEKTPDVGASDAAIEAQVETSASGTTKDQILLSRMSADIAEAISNLTSNTMKEMEGAKSEGTKSEPQQEGTTQMENVEIPYTNESFTDFFLKSHSALGKSDAKPTQEPTNTNNGIANDRSIVGEDLPPAPTKSFADSIVEFFFPQKTAQNTEIVVNEDGALKEIEVNQKSSDGPATDKYYVETLNSQTSHTRDDTKSVGSGGILPKILNELLSPELTPEINEQSILRDVEDLGESCGVQILIDPEKLKSRDGLSILDATMECVAPTVQYRLEEGRDLPETSRYSFTDEPIEIAIQSKMSADQLVANELIERSYSMIDSSCVSSKPAEVEHTEEISDDRHDQVETSNQEKEEEQASREEVSMDRDQDEDGDKRPYSNDIEMLLQLENNNKDDIVEPELEVMSAKQDTKQDKGLLFSFLSRFIPTEGEGLCGCM